MRSAVNEINRSIVQTFILTCVIDNGIFSLISYENNLKSDVAGSLLLKMLLY